MLDQLGWIRNRTAVCLAICIVMTAQAWADPNIQVAGVLGSFDAGAVVTITGQGFGTKVPARPFLWDNFEGGTNGAAIGNPIYGAYTSTNSSVYSNVYPYTGSTCAHSLLSSGEQGGAMGLVSNWIPNEAKDSFASMKFRLVGNITPSNIKLMRFNTSYPDPTHGEPNFNIGKERTATSWFANVNNQSAGQVSTTGFAALAGQGTANGPWHSLSIWDHMGAASQANGFVGRDINGSTVENRNIVTLPPGIFSGTRAAYFCGYISYEGSSVDLYLDDVYADTTMARVLVRNPSGGSLEMQIPQTWSQTSIQILVNTGAYPSGTKLDLIVYDDANNASAPFVVTVGESSGGGDLGPPGMPSTPVAE